jgi:hypothetical protein
MYALADFNLKFKLFVADAPLPLSPTRRCPAPALSVPHRDSRASRVQVGDSEAQAATESEAAAAAAAAAAWGFMFHFAGGVCCGGPATEALATAASEASLSPVPTVD